jgi:hypothetical protein
MTFAGTGNFLDMVPRVLCPIAIINASHSTIGIPLGMLADRIGKEKTLVVGYSVCFVSALYAHVLAVVYGLDAGISETVQRAVIP